MRQILVYVKQKFTKV